MTSREHARRLMLILLSSQASPDATDEQSGEPSEERQTSDGRDDSTDGDERRTSRLVDALILT
jgi:hypothetical protein